MKLGNEFPRSLALMRAERKVAGGARQRVRSTERQRSPQDTDPAERSAGGDAPS